MATQEDIDALVEAMAQLLDDMGADGNCVCLHAKARARIAYEPFCDHGDWEPEMSFTEASVIVSYIDSHT